RESRDSRSNTVARSNSDRELRALEARSSSHSPERSAKIDSGEDDLALLRGIVGLGKALGLQLVAEGIERVAQQGIVHDLGCDGAQGFHFGKPVPATEATQTLTDQAIADLGRG